MFGWLYPASGYNLIPLTILILFHWVSWPQVSDAGTEWDVTRESVGNLIYLDSNTPPFWAYHQTNVVRNRDRVYVTALETLEAGFSSKAKQWHLFEGGEDGWRKAYSSPQGQPLNQPPLVLLDANDTLHVFVSPEGVLTHLRFDLTGDLSNPGSATVDVGYTEFWPWLGGSMNAEGDILICTIRGGDPTQYSYFRDASTGIWSRGVDLVFADRPESPTGYDRHTFPFVVLRGRAVHIFSTQDIEDPVKVAEGAGYTYSYHKLDYYHTPDVLSTEFAAVPVANIEDTRGWLHNDDLLVDRSGQVHILYYIQETELDGRTFTPQMHAFGQPSGPFEHVEIGDAGMYREGRLWESPDGTMHILLPRHDDLYIAPLNQDGIPSAEPRALELQPGNWGSLFAGPRVFLGASRASSTGATVLEGIFRAPLTEALIGLNYFRVDFRKINALAGDFDKDGAVGFSDFLLFATAYGSELGDQAFSSDFDLDGNSAVDFADFLLFVVAYSS